MWGGCLRSFSKGIWVLFMDVFKVWVPSREDLSVQALFGAAIALYWKIFERLNSMHPAFLKHQNNKTSLYKLYKNHWVIALFQISWSVRRELQFTVYLDHPVWKYLEKPWKPARNHETTSDKAIGKNDHVSSSSSGRGRLDKQDYESEVPLRYKDLLILVLQTLDFVQYFTLKGSQTEGSR